MKLRLEQFKGLYTNVDEHELSLDFYKESTNYRHRITYVEFENTTLKEMMVLPNLDVDNGIGPNDTDWHW